MNYNPLACEESSTYELVGTPSYPSEVDGANASFDMTFNYKRTDVDEKCNETITEGSDTVTVEIGTNPSTTSSRTVEDTYDYHGLEIQYSVTQTKFEVKVTAKYNVTSTNPTKIASGTTTFSAIEIDGVKQSSVTTGYTFNTLGEHTVKYTLTDPTTIGYNALRGCSGLTSVVIPNSVTSIGTSAFYYCPGLTSINIPSGVTSIGNSAFTSCNNLTSITVDSSNAVYDSRDNCNAIIETSTNKLIAGCNKTVIPNSVTSIGDYTFYYCSGLTSVTIPDSVTSIGNSAFDGCSSITNVNIGSGVTSIGDSVFYQCSGLTSITSKAMTAPTIQSSTFQNVKTRGTLRVPSGSSGYDVWMGTGNYYLGLYNWTKVEQ